MLLIITVNNPSTRNFLRFCGLTKWSKRNQTIINISAYDDDVRNFTEKT